MSTFTEKLPPDRGKRKDIDGYQNPPSNAKKKDSVFKIAPLVVKENCQVFETEKIAFLKHVDQEITEKEIEEALVESIFSFEKFQRIILKKDNRPTKSVKIFLSDRHNRDTLVKSGLKIGFLKFEAKRALPSNKPLQCFRCWSYGHTSKFCRREELCRKCAEHHSLITCPNQLIKCANCNLPHEANNVQCPKYIEQKEKFKRLITNIVNPWRNLCSYRMKKNFRR